MARKLFKCFVCGKEYDTEEKAIACHDAPVQAVIVQEGRSKPKFLGN
ncbi:MAG: hypothetical protein MUE55_00910 [Thermoplasmata archaeon]|nr:hypothetical protein [Thermoplasmata archaeon]